MLFVNKLNAMFVALNFIIQIDWRIIYSLIMPMLTQFTCSFVGILIINSFFCCGIEFVLYWFSSPTNHITFYGLIRQFCENIRDDFMHRMVYHICSAFDVHFNRMAHSDKNFQLMPFFLVFFFIGDSKRNHKSLKIWRKWNENALQKPIMAFLCSLPHFDGFGELNERMHMFNQHFMCMKLKIAYSILLKHNK